MWLLFLIGCWDREDREVKREEAVRDEMAEHWEAASDLREALIDGDLEGARRSAAAIEETFRVPPEGDVTAGVGVFEGAMLVAGATDVTTAAEGFGEMTWSCGQCHAAVGTAIVAGEPATPGSDEGISAEMERHRAAEERIWLGLVRPDETELEAALAILATAPLVPSGTPADSMLPQRVAELEVSVHDLAAGIAAATGPARGRRYGELLTTCAVCHTIVRDGKAEHGGRRP